MSKALEIQKVKTLVKRQVAESLREILSDPDFGLELSSHATKRLKKSIRSTSKGLYKPFDQVLAKYN